MLTILRDGDEIAVEIGGRVVWRGTISEWSRAIANPRSAPKAA